MNSGMPVLNNRMARILIGLFMIVVSGGGYFSVLAGIKKGVKTFNPRQQSKHQAPTPPSTTTQQSTLSQPSPSLPDHAERYPFSIGEPSLSSARLTIDFLAGPFTITSGATNVAEGELISDQATVETSINGNSGSIVVKPLEDEFIKPRKTNQLTVRLNPHIDYDLNIKGGASQLAINLEDTILRSLNIDVGAISGTVTMPKPQMVVTVTITLGASSLIMKVPNETALSAIFHGGAITVDAQNFSLISPTSHQYQTPHFTQAARSYDVSFNTGAATITFIGY